MTTRLRYLLRYYGLLVALFLLEKPLFMLYCGNPSGALSVMWHGLVLDLATAAYLTIIPFVVLIVSLFFRHLPLRRMLMGYHILIALLASLIFCGDAALYPFWEYKLDASIFFYLQSPKEALASVSAGYLLVGMLTVLLLTALLAWLFIATTPRRLPAADRTLPSRLGQMGLLTVSAFLIFVAMRGGLGKSTANVGKVYFSNNQFLNHSAINPAFSLFYSMGKQEDFSKQFRFFDEPQRERLVSGLFPQESPSDTTLPLLNQQRPDVLLIILEGFGAAFVEELDGMPDVTPNLQRLSQEGILFTQCYAGSFRTDRGMVCLLSGFPGLPTTSLMKMPARSRTLPSISEELLRAGYSTHFIYGGDITFTNTKGYLLSHGYQRITADINFSLAERTSNNWGANDEITFDRLFQEITTPHKHPSHTALLTLSSHEPFEVPYHRLTDPIPNAFAYTDSCLGDFIDRLRATPVWDSLLIVCLPDHGFFYPRNGLAHAPQVHRIPMLWLGGAIREPRRMDVLMNQIDLAATLLAQLGLDHSRFPYSRDILNTSYHYPFAFYTYSNGLAFIDSTGTTLYDLDGSQLLLSDHTSHNEERLQKGQALLQTLYNDLGGR